MEGAVVMRIWLCGVLLSTTVILMVIGPARAECDAPVDEAEQLRCASAELRASDQHINRLYGELRAKLDPENQKQLLNEQRAWLRSRDDACNLDRRISDREEWFRALEATPAKMTCVIRFTTGRNKRLSDWQEALAVEKTACRSCSPRHPSTGPCAGAITAGATDTTARCYHQNAVNQCQLPELHPGRRRCHLFLHHYHHAAIRQMVLRTGSESWIDRPTARDGAGLWVGPK